MSSAQQCLQSRLRALGCLHEKPTNSSCNATCDRPRDHPAIPGCKKWQAPRLTKGLNRKDPSVEIHSRQFRQSLSGQVFCFEFLGMGINMYRLILSQGMTLSETDAADCHYLPSLTIVKERKTKRKEHFGSTW